MRTSALRLNNRVESRNLCPPSKSADSGLSGPGDSAGCGAEAGVETRRLSALSVPPRCRCETRRMSRQWKRTDRSVRAGRYVDSCGGEAADVTTCVANPASEDFRVSVRTARTRFPKMAMSTTWSPRRAGERDFFQPNGQPISRSSPSIICRTSGFERRPLRSTRESAGHRACRTCSPVLLDWPRRGRARHVPAPSRAADNRAPRWRMKPGAENTFKHTALTKLADRERRSSDGGVPVGRARTA